MATEAVVVVESADSEAATFSPPVIDKVFELSEAVTEAVTGIMSAEVGLPSAHHWISAGDRRFSRGSTFGCLMASSSLPITLPLSRASVAGLVGRRCWRRGRKGGAWSSKAEAKLKV